jgi:Protein of unknown function (DUF2867)
MNKRPHETSAPLNSLITSQLCGADFHDSWAIESSAVELPALGHFIAAVARTPKWVDTCMAFRNKTVALLGLKNLGNLAVTSDKLPSEYLPGDRVGIFTLFENTFDEVLLGDKDKHLDVFLSVHRALLPESTKVMVTVTTVVHVKNTLGRLYMLPVKPMHRIIAPTVLGAIGKVANAA